MSEALLREFMGALLPCDFDINDIKAVTECVDSEILVTYFRGAELSLRTNEGSLVAWNA